MFILVLLSSALVVLVRAQSTGVVPLGSMALEMRSIVRADPDNNINPLLRQLLVKTVDFLDEAFYEQLDTSFIKTSCSIITHETAAVATGGPDSNGDTTMEYTASVTLSGYADFLIPEGEQGPAYSVQEMNQFTVKAFEEGMDRYVEILKTGYQRQRHPFLMNLLAAEVLVSRATLADDDKSYPPPSSTKSEDSASIEIWMIALIAGAGAFVLVFCSALTCICCMKVDIPDQQAGGGSKRLTVQTYPTGRTSSSSNDDDDLASKSPTEARSITSQDSSIFTYNPRSVRSQASVAGFSHMCGSTYFTASSAMDMDLAAWQSSNLLNHNHRNSNTSLPFGADISAIVNTSKKDLSLIQEENSSTMSGASSTPSSSQQSLPASASKVTESALNDLAQLERGLGSDEDSTIFILGGGSSSTAGGGGRPTSGSTDERLSLSSQHVMEELQELSHQIDTYRSNGPAAPQPQY